MSDNITITLKVGSEKQIVSFDCEEHVQYTIKLDADEMGGTIFALPGLANPKFIAVLVSDYQQNMLPVEVMLKGSNADPVACTPVALFTADTITSGDNVGGMQDTNFDGLPALHFINGTEASAKVLVIAGE